MTGGSHRRRRRRQGYVLVLVAMLLFGLMAIAALTIDVGLARLTQTQLQAAADTAALEALRRRDVYPVGDPRPRADAATLVAAMFDDDLDPSNGDALQLGAGPVVTLTGGLTELNASQLLTVPASPVYDPALETNAPGNLPHGDFVSGTYDPGQPHDDEDATYARSDFTPAPDAATIAPAMLARLRRTDGRNALDADPGVSSSGPSLPFLFGRGTTIHGQDPTDPTVYDPREHGLTVRATAIADLRPVVWAGHPVPTPSAPGLTRVALDSVAWAALPFDVPQALDIDAAGAVRDAALNVVGKAYVDVAGPVRFGQELVTESPLAAHAFAVEERWLPLFTAVAGAGDRVVAFGRVEVTGAMPGAITLTKRVGGVAHVNASAVRAFALPADIDTPGELAALTAARDSLLTTPEDVLRAPVLVR